LSIKNGRNPCGMVLKIKNIMKNMSYQQITFPKQEWPDIKEILEEKGFCSNTRCCRELNKYKVGAIYQAPWGDLVKIIKVTRYNQLEKIPNWKQFDKGMKISARKGEKYGNSQ
jgi:hypothetical protein